MPDEAFIRRTRMGDGPRLMELADMALHHKGDPEMIKSLGKRAEEHPGDSYEIRANRGVMPLLGSVRVMDRGDGGVVGFSYSCPPMDWIAKNARIPFGVARRVSAVFTEIEMVAVLPRYRQLGYATRLLKDCEDRYREAGYRVAMIAVERTPASLKRWYERRGWRFGEVDEPAFVKFWDSRELSALYGDITRNQRLGFKALVPGVAVENRKVTAPKWRRQGNDIVPVRGTSAVQQLLSVSGVLPD